MPNDYFVRITHSYEAIAQLVSLWALRSERLAVFEHTGTKTEKIHCHILILGSVLQKKQLRNIGSEIVMLKGNEFCSFKECISWETPVVYMTKGKLDAKYLKGWTQADVDMWKSRWVEPKSYQKPNPYQGVYDYVFDSVNGFSITDDDRDEGVYAPFLKLKHHVRRWVFAYHNEFWTPQAQNHYKVCVYTYVMRNKNIPIPDNEWKRWL